MRTPLLNIMVFLEQLLLIIKVSLKNQKKLQRDLNSYCTLIQNQLNFVLTFVEDLLDLQ